MDQEFKSGLTERVTKVLGAKTKRTEEGSFGMQMATHMMETGLMTRRTVKVFMYIKTERVMRELGNTIFKMAEVLKSGAMAVTTPENTERA